MVAFPGAAQSDASSDVIGRRSELDVVDRFVERARGGLASLLIVGDAGIGKTSIWLEAVRRAGTGGARLLRAAPAVSERSLTLGGLTDLLDDVASAELA